MLSLNWQILHFSQLTSLQLYAIIQLRNAVFVVEQNCVFQDADDKDIDAYHILCWYNETLVATSRLLAAGKSYNEASIGRVASHINYRKNGIGKMLMQYSIEQLYQLWGHQPIKIGAQLYLKRFYESFGFVQSSEVYDEDGIDHIEMIKL